MYRIKNKKGYTLPQVLFYAISSVMLLSAFFGFITTSRGANIDMIDKNDIMFQVYNMDNLVRELRYSNEIVDICVKGEPVACDDQRIKFVDNNGVIEKEYEFNPTINENAIMLTTPSLKQSPQYYNVKSASFNKIHRTVSGDTDLQLIEIEVIFEKNGVSYKYKKQVAPVVWMN